MRQRTKNVIAIVSCAVAAVAFAFIFYFWCCGTFSDTKAMQAHAEVRYFADVIEQYRKENGRYPSSAEGFEELARAGYVRKDIRDPWGNKFQYRYPSQRREVAFELWSTPQDVSSSGLGVKADIGNWKQ